MIVAAFVASAVACSALLFILTRLLPADFLAAAINSRSNHTQPARQIGGLGVAPAAIATVFVAALLTQTDQLSPLLVAAAGASLLAVVGYLDDRHDLSVGVRFGAQFAAAALFVLCLPDTARILPEAFPLWLERVAAAIFLAWFVNMTNFMDGLDLMIVSGLGVPHALLMLFGLAGLASGVPVLSAAIAGALMGFIPFNRPPAKIFLGDSGSLSIGFLAGVGVLFLAFEHPLLALLPCAYFMVDSISTILLRLSRRENILRAHSSHAYQVARRGGWAVLRVVGAIAACGLLSTALLALAQGRTPAWQAVALAAGVGIAAALALHFRASARRTSALTAR